VVAPGGVPRHTGRRSYQNGASGDVEGWAHPTPMQPRYSSWRRLVRPARARP
jgi:hypothetical protein